LLKAGLGFRREHPALFEAGEYLSLEATGAAARHVVAFARRLGADWLVVIATRFPLPLLDGSDMPLVPPDRWGDTTILLPESAHGLAFGDVVFGSEIRPTAAIPAAAVLARFPVALLWNPLR
jgi:(1->4)-alpha-D-glucan 1-alpha-D-glucosylmutase